MNAKPRSIVLVVALMHIATAAADDLANSPSELDEILTWLPPNSETLIVANGPLDLPEENEPRRSMPEAAQVFTLYLFAGIQDGRLLVSLHDVQVMLAVEGSRRFTSGQGFGLMHFEGCQILIFDAADNETVHSAMELALSEADRTVEFSGVTAASFSVITDEISEEPDEWTLLVAHPRPGVLLCASDEAFLEELLSRMDEEQTDRAFPEALPEWQYVEFESPVWGIRHYRAETAQDDPSSPLGPDEWVNVPDEEAIGFAFYFDAETNAIVAHYLTDNDSGEAIAKQGWNDPSGQLTSAITEIEPGVIEIRAPMAGDDELIFLLVLLGYLGHGVWI